MNNKMTNLDNQFLESVSALLAEAKKKVKTAVNLSMVYTYFEIGKMIVEEEQRGNDRAEYGKYVISELSKYLTKKFGKGFSATNLKQMRKFYFVYSDSSIRQTLSDEFENYPTTTTGHKFYLSWSHYIRLMRIDNVDERNFYEIESVRNNWSLSELNRQFDTSLYERLALSRDKEKVKELATKEPYVLEFLGLSESATYSEKELETKIIDNLQKFLLELGKGFAFIGRQVRISFEEEHFYIDLVFYNRMLRCFVLFDLKIGKIKHQDIGQMQMYVNYYDREVKLDDENDTIGILLCKDKKESLVKMTLPKDNKQIFASKYQTILPSKEELKRLLDR